VKTIIFLAENVIDDKENNPKIALIAGSLY